MEMLVQDLIALALVYAIIIASLTISLILDKKRSSVDTRKVIHIGIGNFVFVWWMFSANWIMLVFFTIPFVVLLFFTMRKDNAIAKSKIGDISNKGHKTGLFFYAVSITILVALFFNHWVAASIGIVAMTYGDGFGSIVGKRYGRHKTINGKSVEGSFGVFFSTAIMTTVILLFYTFLVSNGYYPRGDVTALVSIWTIPFIAGIFASIAEMISPGAYDNLIIPLSVSTLMVLLGL